MAKLATVMLCALFAGLTSNASASTIFIDPVNYGTIWSYMVESTNDPDNQPYLGTISLNDYGYSQAVVEFDMQTLPYSPDYSLSLNPWSIWGGVDPTTEIGIFSYVGDGLVTRSDYSAGSPAGVAQLNWNDATGYSGPVEFNLSSLIADARASNIRYLGLNILDFTPTMSGVLFSHPYLLASDETPGQPASQIPEPPSLSIVAGAVIAYFASSSLIRRRNRRETRLCCTTPRRMDPVRE